MKPVMVNRRGKSNSANIFHGTTSYWLLHTRDGWSLMRTSPPGVSLVACFDGTLSRAEAIKVVELFLTFGGTDA